MAKTLPHDRVYARLGISDIEGVGVFAIRPIAQGTNVFADDQRSLRWVDAAEVDALPEDAPEKNLYEEFGVRRGDRIGCPSSFNLLTVGWYLNEPREGEEPNLVVTDDFQMIAGRDIAEGEELTIRYDTFSDGSD